MWVSPPVDLLTYTYLLRMNRHKQFSMNRLTFTTLIILGPILQVQTTNSRKTTAKAFAGVWQGIILWMLAIMPTTTLSLLGSWT